MSHDFIIQASRPRMLRGGAIGETTMAEAIESVFPLMTEDSFLLWNWIPIRLSYKYDWSDIMDDVVPLLATMQSQSEGECTAQWPSTTFMATWSMRWNSLTTTIVAEWQSVGGDVLPLLVANPEVIVPTREFMAEWKRPLEVIVQALDEAGYSDSTVPGFAALRAIVEGIEEYGMLYASA
jgi:hypothetical protein